MPSLSLRPAARHRAVARLVLACTVAALCGLWSDPAGAAPRRQGRTGTIVVNSPVLGATVYVNGQEVGTIPIDPLDVTFGKHVVKVHRAGLIAFERQVTLRPGERLVIDATPTRPGALLTIPVNDPSAEALLDGKVLGKLPLREVVITPGSHTVVIRGPNLQPYRESFLAGPHRELVLRPNLRRKDGSIVGFADLSTGRRGGGLDLDLDLDLGPAPAKGSNATAALDLDLDLDLAPVPPPGGKDAKGKDATASLDLDLNLDLGLTPPPPAGPGKDAKDVKVAAGPKQPEPPVRTPPDGRLAPGRTDTVVAQPVVPPPPLPPGFVADPIAAEETGYEEGPPLYQQPWFWGTAAGVVAIGVAVPLLTGMTGGYREQRDPAAVCPSCVTLGTVLNQ